MRFDPLPFTLVVETSSTSTKRPKVQSRMFDFPGAAYTCQYQQIRNRQNFWSVLNANFLLLNPMVFAGATGKGGQA